MKYLARTLTIAAVLATPAFAQDSHQHNDATQHGSAQNQDQKAAQMQDRMQEMRTLMDRIKNETNPEARQQLMMEHMTAMQSGMQMMHEGMQNMMGMSTGQGNTDGHMGMMKERMDMMQMMLDQMKNHQMESEKSRGMMRSGNRE